MKTRCLILCVFLGMPLLALDLNGWNGWLDTNGFQIVVDALDAENEMLNSSGKGGNTVAAKALESPIANSDIATLYFTFRIQNTSSADLNIGLSAETAANLAASSASTNSDLFGPQLRIVDSTLQLRDGGSFIQSGISLSVGETYHVWMTVLNASDEWELRIRGGDFNEITPVSVSAQTRFAFRGSTGNQAMQSLALRANNNNASSNGVLLDHIQLHVETANHELPPMVLPKMSLTPLEPGSMHVTWTAFPGALSYVLEAGHPDGPPFAPVSGGSYDGRSWTGSLPEPGPHGLWFRLVVEEE